MLRRVLSVVFVILVSGLSGCGSIAPHQDSTASSDASSPTGANADASSLFDTRTDDGYAQDAAGNRNAGDRDVLFPSGSGGQLAGGSDDAADSTESSADAGANAPPNSPDDAGNTVAPNGDAAGFELLEGTITSLGGATAVSSLTLENDGFEDLTPSCSVDGTICLLAGGFGP